MFRTNLAFLTTMIQQRIAMSIALWRLNVMLHRRRLAKWETAAAIQRNVF